MPKYNYKKDALTDYFKGKLSAKELDKIARDDFKSGIATKKELSNFLSNKFTQDVMSDTYGIPAGTLVKRVRGLMKFAEGVNEMDPHYPVVSKDDEEEVTENKFAKKPEVTPKQLLKIQNDVRKVNRKIKVYISKHPVTKGRLEIELGHGHDNDAEIHKIYDILKKHTGSWRTGTMFNEGQKRYNQKDGVGKSKYVISYHDGKKKHKDGSDFFDIQIFKNKKDLAKFVNALHKGGYKYGFGESINEEFKSNDRTFEKVYGMFDKRDYFNSQGLAKVKIGNFERALKKNDKGAQQILDKFKGDMGKAKDYITQVITDRKKEQAFNDYKAFKVAVDSIQKGKPQYGAVDLVKSRIHNSSQKYTIALYSALRNKKFTKWKDVHNDVDDLIGESVNEAMKPSQVRSSISKVKKQLMRKWKQKGGYENFGQKELSQMRDKFDYNPYGSSDERQIAKMLDGFDNWAMNYDGNMREAYIVLYSPKKGVKPVTTAAYKDKKDAEKWAKDLGGITMIVKKKVKGIDETKAQINKIKKQAGKKEIKFYDILSNIEKKLGKNRYRAFLVKSLKDFKINGNHYDYRSNAAAEEKLFQVSEVNTNEDLRNWFKSKWVNIGKKDKSGKHPPCGTSGKKRGYAKCVPAKKAASMSKKEKESATRRKRAAQNKSNRGGKSSSGQGKKPINVSTHTGGRKSGTGKGS